MGSNLVPASKSGLVKGEALPAILDAGGKAARFAYQEFFYGEIRNPHTRLAYHRAVRKFLLWCQDQGMELQQISPGAVGQYLDQLKVTTSDGQQHAAAISTKKLALAALRHFFDALVTRHVVILNPAASVRGERYQVVEGKTPEITVPQARKLLDSIDTSNVVGLRDRAVIATMIYTTARGGAAAKLRRRDFYFVGEQWSLRFHEKGGKSREIPVRHDLQGYLSAPLAAYLDVAGLRDAPKNSPLFRTAIRKEKRLTQKALTTNDVYRMIKRRMRDVGLPPDLSGHSLRVAGITDLLSQGVPMEDVQHLAGHADPRTTRLYDRRRRRVTRNIVERISV